VCKLIGTYHENCTNTTSTPIRHAPPLSPHAVTADLVEELKGKETELSDSLFINNIDSGVSLKNPILSKIYHLQ
jgi:hypothetical protein